MRRALGWWGGGTGVWVRMIDRRQWASAAEAGDFFGIVAVRLEVVPFPGVLIVRKRQGVLRYGCSRGWVCGGFPEEERFENKPRGKGATFSRTALGWVGFRL